VNEDDTDVERPQQRHIEQQRWEIVVRDNTAVYGENECFFPELGDILQYRPQIGKSCFSHDQNHPGPVFPPVLVCMR